MVPKFVIQPLCFLPLLKIDFIHKASFKFLLPGVPLGTNALLLFICHRAFAYVIMAMQDGCT